MLNINDKIEVFTLSFGVVAHGIIVSIQAEKITIKTCKGVADIAGYAQLVVNILKEKENK